MYKVMLFAAALFALWCPLIAAAQADGASADLRVLLVKAEGASFVYEQYPTVESVPANTPTSRLRGTDAVRAIASDGDQWFSIQRIGGSNCFVRYASHTDLIEGLGVRRVCNSVVAYDGYRGLAYDGQFFYTIYWDGSRHWWQSYTSWDDVMNNRFYGQQTDARNGDIYKGIAFDPVKRVFLSLAQLGANVCLLKYGTFSDMATVTYMPGGGCFTSGERYAGIAIGPVNPTLSIYLVAGQSNAVGWDTDGAWLTANVDDAQVAFFYRIGFGMDFYSSTSGGVTTLGPQAVAFRNSQQPPTAFGIEMGAARTLYDAGRRRMAVVKVAMGGTDLYEQWSPLNNQGLFKLMQENLSRASVLWNAAGYRTRIVGLFWMQGEADALDLAKAAAYASRLRSFVAAVRQTAGDPCLPVVIGRIRPEWTYSAPVRAAQEQFVAHDSCAAWVNTDDLATVSGDPWHFTSEGEYLLGQRMGSGYISISGW